MTTRSRSRTPGFLFDLLLLGNIASALLNIALGQWIAAGANTIVAAFMWWVRRF